MVNAMLKSSPRDRIQRYYRGKSLSMVGSRGMVSSRKRWCCATGAKLDTCLARIALWLHLPQKILTCIWLSRVILLERVLLLCSQSLLLRLSLQLSLNRHILLLERGLGRGFFSNGWVRLWFWFRFKLEVWRWEWVWIGILGWTKCSVGELSWIAFSGEFVCCWGGSG